MPCMSRLVASLWLYQTPSVVFRGNSIQSAENSALDVVLLSWPANISAYAGFSAHCEAGIERQMPGQP